MEFHIFFVTLHSEIMENIRCDVERIIYNNPENGYSVLQVAAKGYKNYVTLVGNFAEIGVGTSLSVQGNWKVDKRYGQNFVVDTWSEIAPATILGMEKYLGSGLIQGIGPSIAKSIVGKFGLETIDVLDNDIERLFEVPNIGKKRVKKIRESWEKQKEIKNVMLFLQSNGVSTAYAIKIYKHYGKDSISKVKSNPYCLADDIWGIGFKISDRIAASMGYDKNDPRRCRSGILFCLDQLSNEGHVYATHKQLINTALSILEVDEETLELVLYDMIRSKDIILDEDDFYLPLYYYAEVGTAKKLIRLQESQKRFLFHSYVDIDSIIEKTHVKYDEVQIAAIRRAISTKVMVLTGGPGTGKTTTTQGIITAMTEMGLKIRLAAPTGRAAKRMTEATGMEAKTIHRLLEYNPSEGYKRNEDNPINGDVLIVDESSMIDILLMNSLVKAIPLHMRLILVGDIDQLPSVGSGNVLRDIIDSCRIPVVRLTRIFRQAQCSQIIMNAHAVNAGHLPSITNGKNSDFFFLKIEDQQDIANEIVNLVKTRLPKAYHYDSSEIQVLAPMKKGVVGTQNLNSLLQQSLNPVGACLSYGGMIFREKDKVMQIKNNYDKDVFNGDIGFIERVDLENHLLIVNFDGHYAIYESSDLDELTLAYATTIHKSQGSEYPIVVIPVSMSQYIMLQRNLIYTGITRAKKICVVLGSPNAFAYAVRNMTVNKRNTKLCERLGIDE